MEKALFTEWVVWGLLSISLASFCFLLRHWTVCLFAFPGTVEAKASISCSVIAACLLSVERCLQSMGWQDEGKWDQSWSKEKWKWECEHMHPLWILLAPPELHFIWAQRVSCESWSPSTITIGKCAFLFTNPSFIQISMVGGSLWHSLRSPNSAFRQSW